MQPHNHHGSSLLDAMDDILLPELKAVRRSKLPWLAIFRSDQRVKGVVQDLCSSSDQPATHLLTIQGCRCRTSSGLLSTWGDALEFPNYYGRNWDAFNECFSDLLLLTSGLGSAFGDRPGRPVTRLVVQVDDAHLQLAEDREWSLQRFIEHLETLYNDPLLNSKGTTAEFLLVLYVSDESGMRPEDFISVDIDQAR